MTIQFGNISTPVEPLVVENVRIGTVSEVKLLGLTIQNELKWDTQVNDVMCKASKELILLMLLHRSGTSEKHML